MIANLPASNFKFSFFCHISKKVSGTQDTTLLLENCFRPNKSTASFSCNPKVFVHRQQQCRSCGDHNTSHLNSTPTVLETIINSNFFCAFFELITKVIFCQRCFVLFLLETLSYQFLQWKSCLKDRGFDDRLHSGANYSSHNYHMA